MAIERFRSGKTKQEKREFKYALLLEITKKLEWSTTISLTSIAKLILCCPICGGVRPEDYDQNVIDANLGRKRGHKEDCLYEIIRSRPDYKVD